MNANKKPKNVSIFYTKSNAGNQFIQKDSNSKSCSFLFAGNSNFLHKIKKVEPIVKEILKNKFLLKIDILLLNH